MADRLHKLIVSGTLVAKPAAEQYLVCFPWAGGGAAQYIRWNKMFPPDIEVLAVRLPGRETRLKETPYSSVGEMAEDAASLILSKYSDKPISILGHSFGSRLAFETFKALKRKHQLEVKSLFVSGAFAPGSEIGNEILKTRIPPQLTDENLISYLTNLGGTPKAVLENKEMLSMILPPLHSDLDLMRGYSYDRSQPPPVSCPLFIMDGKDDIEHHLHEWQSLANGHSEIKLFPGGHFFLLDPSVQASVTKYITDKLRESIHLPTS